MTRRRKLLVVGAIAALALTGCSVPQHVRPPAAGPAVSSTRSADPNLSPSPTGTLSPNAVTTAPAAPTVAAKPSAPPPPPPPNVDPCQANLLKINYSVTDNTAGQTHGVLAFHNISTKPCYTAGWPTVYFYSTSGTSMNIGAPSKDDHSKTPTSFTIPAGGIFLAVTTISDGTLVEGCNVVTVQNLDGTPPGGDSSLLVPDPDQTACSDDSIALISVQPAFD